MSINYEVRLTKDNWNRLADEANIKDRIFTQKITVQDINKDYIFTIELNKNKYSKWNLSKAIKLFSNNIFKCITNNDGFIIYSKKAIDIEILYTPRNRYFNNI